MPEIESYGSRHSHKGQGSSMGKRAIDVGLIITTVEDRSRDWILSWDEIKELVVTGEQVGFDSVWIPDHLIHEPEGVDPYGIWEAWSLISALAAVTDRVRIGPHVLCTGWRNPALIAKMADTVDEISNGRLILALGAGWHQPEYRAFGFPFDHRIGRFAESVEIITSLLRYGKTTFEGQFSQAIDCELRPRGPSPSGPPIMIGTIAGTPLGGWLGIERGGDRVLDLVARYADIWNCPIVNDPELIPGIREMIDIACVRNDRDPSSLKRTNGIAFNLPGWETTPGNPNTRARRLAMGATEGTPQELAQRLWDFSEQGVAEVHVQLDPETPAGIEQFAATLELLDA
jgi:alkanesulfonate monooxygenase SsuD/methylene tetrahydromethanopterin reductase-like flavin-dependent oxidoreductase (luciferase family)